MIECGIRIGSEDPMRWLREAVDVPGFREIAVSATTLETEPAVIGAIDAYALQVIYVHDLLPADIAAYVPENEEAIRGRTLDYIKMAIQRCRQIGARYTSLDLGLDRIGMGDISVGIAARANFAKAVTRLAHEAGLILCLPVRLPRYGRELHEWDYAANIVHEVQHDACRLVVDIFPAELSAGFDASEFVRSSCFRVGVLRFHYHPCLGEDMSVSQHEEWARVLRLHGFNGAVILCPEAHASEGICTAVTNGVAWSRLYRAPQPSNRP